jgi:type II secretory pathway component PulF
MNGFSEREIERQLRKEIRRANFWLWESRIVCPSMVIMLLFLSRYVFSRGWYLLLFFYVVVIAANLHVSHQLWFKCKHLRLPK